jgi:aminopeptidase YwaD
MKKLIYLAILLIFFGSSFSQDLPYARYILDTLCSPGMHGRGYVHKGDSIAAYFIAGEFQKLELEPLAGNYFQKFNIPINTFPGELSLKINNKLLTPGVDYLVEPGSPSVKGEYKVSIINEEDLLNRNKFINILKDAEGKFIIIDKSTKIFSDEEKKEMQQVINFLKYSPENPAAGTILFTHDKLIWSGSTEQFAKPTFTVLLRNIPSKISSVTVNAESNFIDNYETQNVIGYIKGEKVPDTVIAFIAHYDHLGRMGAMTYFPGANDNASGISMLLNLAKHYKINKPDYSMLFIAFGAEEIGLIGSAYYTEKPLLPLSNIKFLLNFDISGTGDDGIQVVNGSVFQKEFDLLTEINKRNNYLKEVKIRGPACNSDHCFFYEKGVPSFFIYTLGGIQAYHDIFDRSETLPFTKFEDYFKLIVDFVKEL